jgi:hypothetical protein
MGRVGVDEIRPERRDDTLQGALESASQEGVTHGKALGPDQADEAL